jgi:predicted transcriptional regulator
MLIKVLEDANSISKEYTEEMLSIAAYISASPVIITDKAGDKLEDNVVYTRFDIFTLNFNTFVNCINNKFPFIKRSQAGLTASISGKKLKEKREELGYSLNALSKKIGVTSRMMMKYENENSEITIHKAKKLYDIFGHQVFAHVEVFSRSKVPKSKFESVVSKKYVELGFDATETKKTPFDIIAKKDREIILTKVSDKVDPQMQSLSKLLDADNLVIFKKKKPRNIPSMTKKEFMDFDEANELVKFLKEF